MKKQYNKELIIAQWRTGVFTQRDLAYKHGISAAMVNRMVKGVGKTIEKLVNK